MLRGYLVSDEYNPPHIVHQVLVLANNEEEAKTVSEMSVERIRHVLKWNPIRKFFWMSAEHNLKSVIEHLEKWGELKPQILSNDIFVDINRMTNRKKRRKKLSNFNDYTHINEAFELIKKGRVERINRAREMMTEAYDETDRGGFDEWDQTFIELLRDELIWHLDNKGIEKLISTIENNSLRGISRYKSQ